MVVQRLHLNESPYTLPTFGINEAYSFSWTVGSAVHEMPDVGGLPTVDDARYLYSTLRHHLGQTYRLLDDDAFLNSLEEFYSAGASKEAADVNRLWFIQFLLVIALSRAILSQSRIRREPAGAKFFQRAMSLIPDHGSLWKDSVMAIEMLALVGLYLYCVDHRESGHIYVSIYSSDIDRALADPKLRSVKLSV